MISLHPMRLLSMVPTDEELEQLKLSRDDIAKVKADISAVFRFDFSSVSAVQLAQASLFNKNIVRDYLFLQGMHNLEALGNINLMKFDDMLAYIKSILTTYDIHRRNT